MEGKGERKGMGKINREGGRRRGWGKGFEKEKGRNMTERSQRKGE